MQTPPKLRQSHQIYFSTSLYLLVFAPAINVETFVQLSEKDARLFAYVILTLIGIELAQVEGLRSRITGHSHVRHVLSVLTIGSGLAALMVFDRFSPWTPAGKKTAMRLLRSVFEAACYRSLCDYRLCDWYVFARGL